MQPGERLRLTIEKPAAGGRMIARHDGAIVLVSAAIPGETVDAIVEKQQHGTIWAKTAAVLEASPDRVQDSDDGACGGNVFAHVRYERQLALKIDILRDAFTRIGRHTLPADVPIEPSPADGYRMRARLHMQRSRVGFYREGTHALCDAAATRQLLPATIDALGALERALGQLPGIDGAEIELAENIPASERVAHVLLPRPALGPSMRSLSAIPGLTGLASSVPTSANMHVVSGSTGLRDAIDVPAAGGVLRVTLERHAPAFFQGNRYLLARLMASVADLVPAGRVLDLYSGVGPFAMTLAARGDAEIEAVEGDLHGAVDLGRNAERAEGRLVPRHHTVESYLADSPPSGIDTIVVDPPRTGLSKAAAAGVLALGSPRLVYVSCDAPTAARDTRILLDHGHALKSVRAFDMFPNTSHIETVLLFER